VTYAYRFGPPDAPPQKFGSISREKPAIYETGFPQAAEQPKSKDAAEQPGDPPAR
jgi:hypothetical protein